MSDLILINSIKQGCYSEDPEKRERSIGGFYMPAGAVYEDLGEHFVCGTHAIHKDDIDLNMFATQEEMAEAMDFLRRKKQYLKKRDEENQQ